MPFLSNDLNYATKARHGFTLIEVMVVVIIIGALSAVAINNFNKTLETGRCRSAQQNLVAIHEAYVLFHLKNNTYVPLSGTNLAAINNDLNLNIYDNDYTYEIFYPDAATYTVMASRNGGSFGAYNCQLTQGQLTSLNPACTNLNVCPPIIDSGVGP